MVKKFIKNLLAICLLVSLGGCNDNNTDSSKLSNSANTQVASSNLELISVDVTEAPVLIIEPGKELSLQGGKLQLKYNDDTQETIDLESAWITYVDYFSREIEVSYQGKKVNADIIVPGTVVNDEEGLLEALNSNGNLILLQEGEYEMQIVIEKNCVLIGAGREKVTINGPKEDDEFIQYEKIEGELYDYAGFITVIDSTVTIMDLTIQPTNEKCERAMYLAGYSRACGVAVLNSKLFLSNVNILDITFSEDLKGMQNGYGIYAIASESDKWLRLRNCRIENFNKCGIMMRVSVSELDVENCIIKGFGETPLIAQNGIVYSNLVRVISTYFEGLSYTGNPEVYSCALLRAVVVNVEWDNCLFSNNEFVDVDQEHGGV